MLNFNIEEIKSYIEKNSESKIYLGCDSQRIKKKKVKFATVLVIHNTEECTSKLFYDIQFEKVQDAKLSRPFNRMLKEVQYITELYALIEDIILDKDFEIHLDISENPEHGSNVAHGAAKGMIWGICGIKPTFKPDSFISSCVADRYSK